MFFNKFSLQLICCDIYKKDPVIRDLYNCVSDNCETALDAYSSLCFKLAGKGVTLSDYIFNLIVSFINPALKTYMATRNCNSYDVFSSDIAILSLVSKLRADDIINYLVNKFNLSELSFPRFETGDTDVSTEVVLAYVENYGTSLFAENKAFVYEHDKLSGIVSFDGICLSSLKNYVTQRKKLIDNTVCFMNGYKAHNALLYGDRGTGKSSTIKAIANEFEEIRIVQISKSSIREIYRLYDILRDIPLKFILFIDDITFGENDEDYSFFKQVLEGSVVPMPGNCVIYATTNRRHVIKETFSERSGDELHASDARDENMSLADRFGLYITFLSPDKKEYLDIVYQLVNDTNIDIEKNKLEYLAERYALKKCGRSPRTAKQFVDILKSRIRLGMDIENL